MTDVQAQHLEANRQRVERIDHISGSTHQEDIVQVCKNLDFGIDILQVDKRWMDGQRKAGPKGSPWWTPTSACLPVCLSVCPSVCPSVRLSVCLSVCQYIYSHTSALLLCNCPTPVQKPTMGHTTKPNYL